MWIAKVAFHFMDDQPAAYTRAASFHTAKEAFGFLAPYIEKRWRCYLKYDGSLAPKTNNQVKEYQHNEQ